MNQVGSEGGTQREHVYTGENTTGTPEALEDLLRNGNDPDEETVAAGLFWIFEHKTNVQVETARLQFRQDGTALLSVPDKTFHVDLRISAGDRYTVDHVRTMAENVDDDHEFLLITTHGLTEAARTDLEATPSMHYIGLQRALQFDEAARSDGCEQD